MPRWKERVAAGKKSFSEAFLIILKNRNKFWITICFLLLDKNTVLEVLYFPDKIFSNVYRFRAWPSLFILLSYFQTRKAVCCGTIKKATNHQHSHSIFVGFSGCIPQGSQAGRKARQCHHQGIVPPGGENIPDYSQQSGACYSSRHRSSLGQRWSGYSTKIFRLYRQQYQGKTDEFGIHRPDRW